MTASSHPCVSISGIELQTGSSQRRRRPAVMLFGLPTNPVRTPPAVARPPLAEIYRGRMERREELGGQENGALRVARFVRVQGAHALWLLDCRRDHGGCGGQVILRASEVHRRSNCGCRDEALVTHEGLTLSLLGWERELRRRGIQLSRRTLQRRFREGWDVAEALSTPAESQR